MADGSFDPSNPHQLGPEHHRAAPGSPGSITKPPKATVECTRVSAGPTMATWVILSPRSAKKRRSPGARHPGRPPPRRQPAARRRAGAKCPAPETWSAPVPNNPHPRVSRLPIDTGSRQSCGGPRDRERQRRARATTRSYVTMLPAITVPWDPLGRSTRGAAIPPGRGPAGERRPRYRCGPPLPRSSPGRSPASRGQSRDRSRVRSRGGPSPHSDRVESHPAPVALILEHLGRLAEHELGDLLGAQIRFPQHRGHPGARNQRGRGHLSLHSLHRTMP